MGGLNPQMRSEAEVHATLIRMRGRECPRDALASLGS
jgi:hypothetical protein